MHGWAACCASVNYSSMNEIGRDALAEGAGRPGRRARALPRAIARDPGRVADRVRLRTFQRADLRRVIAWRSDEDLRRGALWSDAPFGLREAQRWLRAVSDGLDTTRLTHAVELRVSRRLVGLTTLTRIDRRTCTAYLGLVIGEKDCWGQGIAREALQLMLARAARIGLRKILLEVAADNPRAIALYKRAGFQTEGVLRRQLPRGRTFVDVMIMAVFLS
jgi:RimJ/RimL family protein N-acetyltransferase